MSPAIRARLTALGGAALLASALALTAPVIAQSPEPPAAPPPSPDGSADPPPSPATAVAAPEDWPSGDALRRDLQDIGFAFRIDRDTGDWLGFAPRATPVEAPALALGSDGDAPAWARFTFETLEVDLFGGDVDAALTAFVEVASRTPLPGERVRTAFRFLADELLVEAPILQEPCYASADDRGAIVIRLDPETGSASVLLAATPEAHPDGEDIEDCARIALTDPDREPGTARSERLTIAIADDGLDPSEVVLEGALVTLILTVRNDSATERSLAFAPPLEAATGPIPPGGSTLIVIRRLEPGDYPLADPAAPDDVAGVVRVVLPEAE